MKIKKTVLFLIIMIMSVPFCACNNSSTETPNLTEDKSNVETSVQESIETESIEEDTTEIEKIKKISIGETVKTKNYKFKLKKVELSYEVKPDNPPSYYTYYAAEDEHVYIHIDADIKNTSKKTLGCDEIYTVTADYNKGYTYEGFAIAEDTDGDFTYANITQVSPLETLGVHTLIDCPDVVERKNKSLKIIFTMSDESKYEYVIRK